MRVDALGKLREATRMLAEVRTAGDAKNLMNLAALAKYYAEKAKLGRDAINLAHSIRVDAQKLLGQFLKTEVKHDGARGVGTHAGPTLAKYGLTKNESSEAQRLAEIAKNLPNEYEAIRRGEKSVAKVTRERKRAEVNKKLESIEAQEAKAIAGVYDVVVIDPPWPMDKIERDVRPNEVGFDYPVMTLEQLRDLAIPVDKTAHVWLWTTPRFLPDAFTLLEAWNLTYACPFVWHKPGGFQPFGLPQFNCEFALYARRGSPVFTDTKAFPLCFEAPRGAHSEKPEEFYENIRRVTAGRRLDMFNRRAIEGFDGWGKESSHDASLLEATG